MLKNNSKFFRSFELKMQFFFHLEGTYATFQIYFYYFMIMIFITV